RSRVSGRAGEVCVRDAPDSAVARARRRLAYDGSMETRTLPGTGLTVSRACFGTMTFGAQTDRAAAERMVDLYFDRGVSLCDTAKVETDGAAEVIRGEIPKGGRAGVVVATKVGSQPAEPDAPRLSRAAILKQIDLSLGRLQTDYVDLYYLHTPDPQT